MEITQIIYLIIVFIIVVSIILVIIRLFVMRSAKKRLNKIVRQDSNSAAWWKQSINKFSGPLAVPALPSETWEGSALRTRFMHAGYHSRSLPMFYFAAKTFLVLVFAGMSLLYMGVVGEIEFGINNTLLLLLLSAALGYYLPDLILSRVIFLRQRVLFENIPDVIDLMTICIESGMGLEAAMNKVAEEIHLKCQPLAEELRMINLDMRAGRTREQALYQFALRTGVEEIRSLVVMLVQAERFGTSIATSLRVHSEELRTRRRLRAEEAAAKIALKLLFPLMFFIFPALFVVLFGPAIIQIVNILLPTLAGQ